MPRSCASPKLWQSLTKLAGWAFAIHCTMGKFFFSNTGDRMGFDTRGSFKVIKKMSHSNFYSLKLKQTFTKKKYLANIYYLLTSLHHLFDSTDLEIYKCKTCLQSSAYMCTGLSLTWCILWTFHPIYNILIKKKRLNVMEQSYFLKNCQWINCF